MTENEIACSCPVHADSVPVAERTGQLLQALRLEYLTVAWNVIEGLIAVSAALAAGSIALLGFGIDSFVEMASGLILIWRLGVEARHVAPIDLETLDRRAHRFVGLSLFLLAAFVFGDGAHALLARSRPEPSLVGLALTAISLPAMLWLGRAKRSTARRLESRAMESDAFQTTACMWLSAITLVGIGLNAAFGWWWADPVAALAMTYFLVQEGREAWHGQECCPH
jgi:divalent metal cation (Fe/Co/Zn/Cd) transporter